MAGGLDNKFRRWFQDPKTILGPYIKNGMTVLDLGCGPGFLTIDIAHMVGKTGKVIAADVQDEMLEKLRNKIKEKEIERRIQIHKCDGNRIGIMGPVDFVVAFYVLHEISNQEALFCEINNIMKDGGFLFIVEPKLFHVSKSDFEQTVGTAIRFGFERVENVKICFSRGVILRKCQFMSKCLDVAG
jgi:ubiquinone/menaquinone biosynthesis C-methylase UbiE